MQNVYNALDLLQQNSSQILKPVLILLVGWVLAKLAQLFVEKVTNHLHVPHTDKKATHSLGTVVYWLVWLFVLPILLNSLGLNSVLGPVQNMLNTLLGYLPNLFGAGLILFIGLLAARIIREVVTGVCTVAKLDEWPKTIGIKSTVSLSNVLGQIVGIFIIVPVIISALEALAINSITLPAVAMLQKILSAVPNIVTAILMLTVGIFIGNFCKKIVVQLLESLDFNGLIKKAGLSFGSTKPTTIVGSVVMLAIVLVLTVEAVNMLQFSQLTLLLTTFLQFAGTLLVAVIMMLIGLMFANKTYDLIKGSSKKLAMFTRVAIIVFVAGLSLDYTSLAPVGFISNAFSLLVAALAVAVAIAFGIGGREAAKHALDKWTK